MLNPKWWIMTCYSYGFFLMYLFILFRRTLIKKERATAKEWPNLWSFYKDLPQIRIEEAIKLGKYWTQIEKYTVRRWKLQSNFLASFITFLSLETIQVWQIYYCFFIRRSFLREILSIKETKIQLLLINAKSDFHM